MRRQVARRGRPPAPYKSQFEARLHTGPLAKLLYEPKGVRIPYVTDHVYVPDFVSARTGVLYEAKGRFRTSVEARKYREVRAQNPEVELRFILANPSVRAYPGSRATLAEWMDRLGFSWCPESAIPNSWRS